MLKTTQGPLGRISLTLALAVGTLSAETVRGDEVLVWNNALLNAIRADRTAPPLAARNLAMVHIAVYDAVNSIAPTHEPYLSMIPAPPGASPRSAAVGAGHRVLSALYPQHRASFDALYQRSLAAIPEAPGKAEGVGVGQAAANAILQARQADAAVISATIPPTPPGVGVWEPTEPGMTPLLPAWGRLTPFAMRSSSQFRQKGPPKPQTGNYANAFEQVKALGARNSTVRTPEQTQIAHFWVDGPGTATPPGHWNVIAQGVSQQQGLDLLSNARVFALLNIALADAGIAAWDMKYTYYEWRPVTGIRRAAEDNNNRTVPDPAWEPLLPTPPFPDYVSGHSTFSSAGAEMLGLVFGSDRIAFATTSDGLPGVQRSYQSFSQAAEEAGQSRIYGGIHWGHADKDGLMAGRQLARQTFNHHLKRLTGQGTGTQPGNVSGSPPATKGQSKGQGRRPQE